MSESETAGESEHYAAAIMHAIREPLLVLDAALRVKAASRSLYTTFKVTAEQSIGRFLYELGNRQ
jgi:hypothetical protein